MPDFYQYSMTMKTPISSRSKHESVEILRPKAELSKYYKYAEQPGVSSFPMIKHHRPHTLYPMLSD